MLNKFTNYTQLSSRHEEEGRREGGSVETRMWGRGAGGEGEGRGKRGEGEWGAEEHPVGFPPKNTPKTEDLQNSFSNKNSSE